MEGPTSLSLWVLFLLFLYGVGLACYRISFHPLSRVPGPKLAAVTQLYQTFYCYYNGESRFYKQVEHLHNVYGPVVRITPNEVSLSDPKNYEEIYHIGTQYYKSHDYYRVFGAPSATFTTIENSLHSRRRAVLNPFFSRKAVLKLEAVVQDRAKRLIERLEAGLRDLGSVELHHLFGALSVDVVSDYVFHDCYDLLKKEEAGKEFTAMVRGVLKGFWFFMQSSTIETLMLMLPHWISETSPTIKKYNALIAGTKRNVLRVKTQIDSGQAKPERLSIFHQLLDPNAVEDHVLPTVDQLTDEALSILVAAAAATGNAMTMIVYHVITNTDIYERLRKEITVAFPNDNTPMSFLALEKLPYLTGVIKEGLRLSYGVIGRLPRVVPAPGAVFNGYALPTGTVVGMSSWMMHRQPSVFPDPDKFDPTRWLDATEARLRNKCLVAFGKDSRQCIGMPLAYCELYVTVALMFYKFNDLEIHGVGPEDLVYDDYFSGYHPERARDVRVRRLKI